MWMFTDKSSDKSLSLPPSHKYACFAFTVVLSSRQREEGYYAVVSASQPSCAHQLPGDLVQILIPEFWVGSQDSAEILGYAVAADPGTTLQVAGLASSCCRGLSCHARPQRGV